MSDECTCGVGDPKACAVHNPDAEGYEASSFAAPLGSADRIAKLSELSDNAWDIGTVDGVLQGVALTPTLLPNQKEAISSARKAIARIGERNKVEMERMAHPPNAAGQRRHE